MHNKKNYFVEKSNTLNTLMCNDISLIELRFFCLYLSKLNARNIEQRTVDIPLSEFEKFFDVKLNITLFTKKIRKIMSRTVEIKENGKIRILTLYSEFCWSEVKPNSITITCNDKMLPYIFELRKNYTSYTIGNIAKLNSVQKIRLYEICKQYEKISIIKFDLEDLKLMMCSNQSADFRHFRTDTLEPAIKSINENTDIIVTYEKVLSCRKVVALKFTIKSKVKKIKEIECSVETVEKPAEMLPEVVKVVETPIPDEIMSVYRKCNMDYTLEQLKTLWDLVEMMGIRTDLYIISAHANAKCRNVKNIYAYTLAVIQNDVKNIKVTNEENSKNERKTSYDLEEFKDFIHSTKRIMHD